MNKTSYQPASFFLRLLAMLIDNLILGFLLSPIFVWIFGEVNYSREEMLTILETQGIFGLFNASELFFQQLTVLLITMFFWVRFSGTPAKRLLGLRIVDARTGNNLTAWQSILRYLGYTLSALPFCLGFLWVIFDKDKQAWHDKLANSLVIIDKPKNRHHQPSSSAIERDIFEA